MLLFNFAKECRFAHASFNHNIIYDTDTYNNRL